MPNYETTPEYGKCINQFHTEAHEIKTKQYLQWQCHQSTVWKNTTTLHQCNAQWSLRFCSQKM